MRLATCALSALALSCAHLPVRPGCELELEGIEAIAPGTTLLLGDLHGTREIPRFTGALACTLAKRHPVVLGLEMPAHPTFDAFLASDGGPAARAALLRGPFWQDRFQDGRRSVAALELLEQVRQWRASGVALDVFFFDAAGDPARGLTRDAAMAEHVRAMRGARPDATFVLMMGNLHARKTPGSPWKPGDSYAWLASLVPAATSLNVRHPLGTAWVCFGSEAEACGPQLAHGDDAASSRPGVSLHPSREGAYDGTFDVGALTASPPAAFPERATGLDQRIAALLDSPRALALRARSDYQRGDFEGCARRLEALSAPTANDLYTQACCLARAGQKDRALEKLRGAVDHGFRDVEAMRLDEDLRSLHGDPRWPSK